MFYYRSAIISNMKRIVLLAFVTLVGAAGVSLLGSCSWGNQEDLENDGTHHTGSLEDLDDPLPGELVKRALVEDSIVEARREKVRENMISTLNDYSKRFRNSHFTGYFLTDLDHNGEKELWIKSGTNRENSRFELYYPHGDGELMRSGTIAEPGRYYLGDGYIIQVVSAGAGIININRITIHKGEMDVENIREIDFYKNPDATVPKIPEPEILNIALTNIKL